MPEKKRTMNDMIVTKKTVVKKQVLSAPQKQREVDFKEEEIIYQGETQRKSRAGCLLWVIASVCALALVVGVGGLFTHAEILVTPKQFTGSIDATMNLSQGHDDGVFFGTATKTFTSEKVVPSIGQAMNEVKATGTIKFYNTNTISKTVPAKTEIISSKGKKYITSKTVTIPPKGAKNPGQMDVNVTAVVVGVEGNSGLDDFTFSKPSKLLSGITIHSVTEITGGASTADAVGDPAMINSSIESLRKEFSNTQTFIARLSEQVPDSMIALPLMLPENPVTIVTDPKHEDGVHVVASQTVTIIVVDRADIARMLGNSLEVPKDIQLTIKKFGDVTIMTNNIVAGQPIPQKVQVRITGQVTVFGLLDTEIIKEKILGVSRKEIKKYMTQVPEVDSYKIRMRPFWRRVLPMNVEDVEVLD